jgi:hypothetical protein
MGVEEVESVQTNRKCGMVTFEWGITGRTERAKNDRNRLGWRLLKISTSGRSVEKRTMVRYTRPL